MKQAVRIAQLIDRAPIRDEGPFGHWFGVCRSVDLPNASRIRRSWLRASRSDRSNKCTRSPRLSTAHNTPTKFLEQEETEATENSKALLDRPLRSLCFLLFTLTAHESEAVMTVVPKPASTEQGGHHRGGNVKGHRVGGPMKSSSTNGES